MELHPSPVPISTDIAEKVNKETGKQSRTIGRQYVINNQSNPISLFELLDPNSRKQITEDIFEGIPIISRCYPSVYAFNDLTRSLLSTDSPSDGLTYHRLRKVWDTFPGASILITTSTDKQR